MAISNLPSRQGVSCHFQFYWETVELDEEQKAPLDDIMEEETKQAEMEPDNGQQEDTPEQVVIGKK